MDNIVSQNPTIIFLIICICFAILLFLFRKKIAFSIHSRYRRQNIALNQRIQSLTKELNLLRGQYSTLERENKNLCKQLEQYTIGKRTNAEIQKNKQEIESIISNNLSKYCHTKTSFLTKPESEMLYAMKEILNHILSTKQRKYYHIFPQVNFYAFIEQNKSITEYEKNICQRLIGGKHADFILCHRNYFEYTPILIIELDDLSHFTMKYGKEQFSKTQKNDRLKNNFATDLNLPLLRYRLSYGEITKADKDILTDALSKFFFDLYNNQQKSIYFYSKNGILSKEEYYK